MENKDYYVYAHRTGDAEAIFYIGKGRHRRAFAKSSRNRWWKNIVNKHGYIVEFIAENLTEKEALLVEVEEISKHRPAANISIGGRGGCTGIKRSIDDIAKRSETQRKQRACPKWKAMNSAIQKEVQNRPEVKAKVAEGLASYRDKIRNGDIKLKGHTWTDEEKAVASERQKGSKGHWYGKISGSAKPVINLTTGQEFPSLTSAAESVRGIRIPLARSIKLGRTYKKNLFVFKKSQS